MDWFERLMGFPEGSYADTRDRMKVEAQMLHSTMNGKSYGIGELELVSLQDLRERAASVNEPRRGLKVTMASGDVRRMHRLPENAGAVFQVASQFNLLEMVSSNVTPEDGVTGYQDDRTQGPACAIAAGAATIYRNYFVPVQGSFGQTAKRQLDGLADLGVALAADLGRPIETLWQMTNGYALCTRAGLDAISEHLERLDHEQLDALRGKLRVGVHSNVEVTDGEEDRRPRVSQVFCSALPISYTRVPSIHWERFASLVLEAAYEATMLAAVLNKQRGMSNVVLLTHLGGGAFGNDPDWIDAAIRRALSKSSRFDLDVKLVSFGEPAPGTLKLVDEFG